MTKYHINDNGDAKVCSAQVQCPLGNDSPHFEGSLNQARKWASDTYEKQQESQYKSLNTLNKNNSKKFVNVGKYKVPEKHKDGFSLAYRIINDELGAAFDEEYADKTLDLVYEYMNKTDNIICARTRVVFMDEDSVIKIPINDEGVTASSLEVRTSDGYIEKPDDYIPIAKTDAIEKDGVFFIKMEKVSPIKKVNYSALPFWVGMVDGGQVGYTKNNVLVAYDL